MKTLALAQHLGLEVFEFEGTYYVGATQEEFDKLNEESEASFDEQYCETEYTNIDLYMEENGDLLEVDGQEFAVYTDSEADEAWDAMLDQYIDDCVLPEIPEAYRAYFDYEKYKQDCKYDGRGHTLSSYDGEENEETVDGETYYIYRTN